MRHLIIDHDAEYRERFALAFEDSVCVESIDVGLHHAARNPVDLVVIAARSGGPRRNGLDVVRELHQAAPAAFVVVVAEEGDYCDEDAHAAFADGADAYISRVRPLEPVVDELFSRSVLRMEAAAGSGRARVQARVPR